MNQNCSPTLLCCWTSSNRTYQASNTGPEDTLLKYLLFCLKLSCFTAAESALFGILPLFILAATLHSAFNTFPRNCFYLFTWSWQLMEMKSYWCGRLDHFWIHCFQSWYFPPFYQNDLIVFSCLRTVPSPAASFLEPHSPLWGPTFCIKDVTRGAKTEKQRLLLHYVLYVKTLVWTEEVWGSQGCRCGTSFLLLGGSCAENRSIQGMKQQGRAQYFTSITLPGYWKQAVT